MTLCHHLALRTQGKAPHMPVDAIVLVLIASVVHAGWNVLLHDAPDREASMAVAGLVTGIAMIPLMIIWPPWQAWPFVLLSGAAHSAYALFLAAAYRRGMLSVSYPVARGSAPLLVTLGGWILLSQEPGLTAIFGAVLLGSGLIIITQTGRRTHQGAAVAFALLTGVAIASYQIIDARAVQDVDPPGYLGAMFLVQGVLITFWLRISRGAASPTSSHAGLPRISSTWLAHLDGSWKTGTLIAIGSTSAYLLVVFALQLADAGRVATLREVSILLGMAISRQTFDRASWIGASLVVAGVILAAF